MYFGLYNLVVYIILVNILVNISVTLSSKLCILVYIISIVFLISYNFIYIISPRIFQILRGYSHCPFWMLLFVVVCCSLLFVRVVSLFEGRVEGTFLFQIGTIWYVMQSGRASRSILAKHR